jgi:hypothetical protein
MTDDALDPELPDDERETLQAVGHLLRRDRPVPRAAFRGDLGRRLAAQPPRATRPRRLWGWATASGASGLALLALAAVGLGGAGPLAG